MKLYALLVGIDDYQSPVPPLRGCRNDIESLADYLQARTGVELALRTLYDNEGTREAVISAFRDHLGQAGPGDVALFAYAGHGSEEPVPTELADLEPTGRIQTLMFHDCNRRVDGQLRRALADKELSVLLATLAGVGAHVAVILDCCHSGGATREGTAPRGWSPEAVRDVDPELWTARPAQEFVAGALEHWQAPAPQHVALAACRSTELAKEHQIGDMTHGAFSSALLETLQALGSRATYRTVLDNVRAKVERTTADQRPELFPLDRNGLGDGLFLDGTVTPAPATFRMTRTAGGWSVDAGLVHGLRAPMGDEAFVLACEGPNGEAAGRARVTEVAIGSSVVEPVGWTPADLAYDAVIAEVPLPAGEVVVDRDLERVAPEAVAAIRSAVDTAGPDGAPSPFVRVVGADAGIAGALRLLLTSPSADTVQIARLDGTAVGPPTPIGAAGDAELVVSRLEHVVRWEQVRGIGEHPSPLHDAVTLDVYDAPDGEDRRPPDRQPRASAGGQHLEYHRRDDGTLAPPRVYLDVTNRSDDDLYVAVLDLTDRFRCHAVLPTTFLLAGRTLALWDRQPIPVELPEGRAVETGANVRDWLKVVVSDVDFDATSADLPALDEPIAASRSARPPRSSVERMFAKAVSRDIGTDDPPPDAPARWAATTIELETTVP